MTFDIPHMIATAVIVVLVSLAFRRFAPLQEMSRGRRLLLMFVTLVAALLLLNLVWPYGTGA